MSKKFIVLSQIKDLQELVSKIELITSDLYDLIDRVEVKYSKNGNRPTNTKPRQHWYDEQNDQLWLYTGINGDKLIA